MPSVEPRYYTIHDVRMRLDRSILLYKGVPVWARVPEQTEKMEVVLFSIPDNKLVSKINPNSLDLDIASLPLGYVQFGEICYYVCRAPYRRQKQGISTENMLGYHNLDTNDSFHIGEAQIFTSGFSDMLLGKYPDFNDVLRDSFALVETKSARSCAFSRDFALFKPRNKSSISLLMNNTLIGDVNKEKNGVVLKPPNDNSLIILRLAELGIRITYD